MDGDQRTRRQFLKAGGVFGLLGASGCLRLTQAEGGAQAAGARTTTETATPTESTTQTSTTTDESGTQTTTEGEATYPPGVTADSVSPVLVQSHFGELAGKPTTVTTEYKHRQATAKLSDRGALVTTGSDIEMYIAGRETYSRYDVGGQTVWSYRDGVLREYERSALRGESVLRTLLRGGNYRPVGTQTVDGETTFLLRADEVTDPGVFESNRYISRYFRESDLPVEGIDGTGRVTPNGVIRELSAYLETSGESGDFSVETTNVGSTEVSKPSWASTAKANEATFEVSLTDDEKYITLSHTAGQRIDYSVARAEIDAYDESGYFDGSFAGTTSPGTTLYLYKTDQQSSGDRALGISKGSKPDTAPADSWGRDPEVNVRLDKMKLVRYRNAR